MSFFRRFALLILVFGSALNVGFAFAQDETEALPLAPAGTANETYFAPFPVAITLDGEIEDWAGVPWVELSRPFNDTTIRFAAAADADNLYFVADVTDAAIIAGQHNTDYWNEDSVELYLNGTGDLKLRGYADGVAQLTLPAVNIGAEGEDIVVAGLRGSTINATSIMVATEKGYLVEVAVPLTNDVWEIAPEHGGIIGFNVHLNAALTANRDTKIIWSALDVADTSYQTPSVFGQLVFFEIGAEEVVVVETTPDEEDKPALDPSVTWESREWELFWSDEFDGEAGSPINTDNWTAETGGHGWGNNEHEYYTARPENASLDGEGNLAIVARKENPGDYRCHYGKCEYTSARLISRDKIEFTYGRVEARIKVPRGQGIWPAFWMLGANFGSVGWPNSGELDILEIIGKEPNTLYATVHGPGYSGAQGIGGHISRPQQFADDFHVYAIDWDEDAIRWYVDGEMFFALTPQDLGSRKWVFDHDFFLLLNVAVGGNWPGYPDETTVFPQTMLVDYVRVYKLAE